MDCILKLQGKRNGVNGQPVHDIEKPVRDLIVNNSWIYRQVFNHVEKCDKCSPFEVASAYLRRDNTFLISGSTLSLIERYYRMEKYHRMGTDSRILPVYTEAFFRTRGLGVEDPGGHIPWWSGANTDFSSVPHDILKLIVINTSLSVRRVSNLDHWSKQYKNMVDKVFGDARAVKILAEINQSDEFGFIYDMVENRNEGAIKSYLKFDNHWATAITTNCYSLLSKPSELWIMRLLMDEYGFKMSPSKKRSIKREMGVEQAIKTSDLVEAMDFHLVSEE